MKTQLTIPYPSYYAGSYHIHVLAIFLIFMTACSVFKDKGFYQADSLLRRNEKLGLKAVENSRVKIVEVYTSEDSADKQYSVEISPKGLFKYSMTDGFSGEADRVVISGKIKEGKKVRDSARAVQTSSLRVAAKGTESTLTHTQVKEKVLQSKKSHFYFVAGCLTIFILIYVLIRFLIKPVFLKILP